MPYQKWYESEEEFKKRATMENLEKITGSSQKWYESEDEYIKRATKEALEKNSGTRQSFFESDESYINRATKEALEKKTGMSQKWYESDDEYISRAGKESIRQSTGLEQRFFESDSSYVKRALEKGPSDPPSTQNSNSTIHTEKLGSTFTPVYMGRPSSSDSDTSQPKEPRPIWLRILRGIGCALLGALAGIVISFFVGIFALILQWLFEDPEMLNNLDIIITSICAVIGFCMGFSS